MPTLIVEDGTNVTNANTYIDVAYLNSYAADRGLSLPSTTLAKEILIVKAMDYVERRSFKGETTDDDQPLKWPRANVYVDCKLLPDDEIPVLLKKALAQLAIEQNSGVLLFPEPNTTTNQGFVTEKTVGPLTKKFSSFGVISSQQPIKIASVENYLDPLLGNGCGCGDVLQTVRI